METVQPLQRDRQRRQAWRMRDVSPTGGDWLARRSMRPPQWQLLLLPPVEVALDHHLVAAAACARPAAPWQVDEHSMTWRVGLAG